MVQRAKRTRFLLEPRATGRITGHVRRKDLDGHHAVQALIPRPPNLAHATFAELVDDFVIT